MFLYSWVVLYWTSETLLYFNPFLKRPFSSRYICNLFLPLMITKNNDLTANVKAGPYTTREKPWIRSVCASAHSDQDFLCSTINYKLSNYSTSCNEQPRPTKRVHRLTWVLVDSICNMGPFLNLRGMDTFHGRQLCQFFLVLYMERICSQRENFFPDRVDPFIEGDWCTRKQTKLK